MRRLPRYRRADRHVLPRIPHEARRGEPERAGTARERVFRDLRLRQKAGRRKAGRGHHRLLLRRVLRPRRPRRPAAERHHSLFCQHRKRGILPSDRVGRRGKIHAHHLRPAGRVVFAGENALYAPHGSAPGVEVPICRKLHLLLPVRRDGRGLLSCLPQHSL